MLTLWTNSLKATEQVQHCYTPTQVDKLASAIVDLKKCNIALGEKEKLIQEQLIKFSAGTQWWQEPQMVVGGLVITAGVSALVTAYLISQKDR